MDGFPNDCCTTIFRSATVPHRKTEMVSPREVSRGVASDSELAWPTYLPLVIHGSPFFSWSLAGNRRGKD
jgi:hypothetical protein